VLKKNNLRPAPRA